MDSPKTVLVVEDDGDTRAAYSQILESENYRVVEAPSGEEALEYLSRAGERPAVILVDLSMPGLNGREFISTLRSNPSIPRIPVIVISGWRDIAEQAEQIGAQDFIRKPCGLDEMLAKVASHCGQIVYH